MFLHVRGGIGLSHTREQWPEAMSKLPYHEYTMLAMFVEAQGSEIGPPLVRTRTTGLPVACLKTYKDESYMDASLCPWRASRRESVMTSDRKHRSAPNKCGLQTEHVAWRVWDGI